MSYKNNESRKTKKLYINLLKKQTQKHRIKYQIKKTQFLINKIMTRKMTDDDKFVVETEKTTTKVIKIKRINIYNCMYHSLISNHSNEHTLI